MGIQGEAHSEQFPSLDSAIHDIYAGALDAAELEYGFETVPIPDGLTREKISYRNEASKADIEIKQPTLDGTEVAAATNTLPTVVITITSELTMALWLDTGKSPELFQTHPSRAFEVWVFDGKSYI